MSTKPNKRHKKTFIDCLKEKPDGQVFQKYSRATTIMKAQELLNEKDLSEELVLGARGVLLMNGLI